MERGQARPDRHSHHIATIAAAVLHNPPAQFARFGTVGQGICRAQC
jgi:hypothetical protein